MSDYLYELLSGLLTTLELTACSLLLGGLLALLLTGLLAIRLKAFVGKRAVRIAAGLIVLAFGCRGLFGAVRMMAS